MDLGQAYVQIVPSAQGISGAITNILDPEAKSGGETTGKTVGSQIASFATKTIAALGVGKAVSDSISNGMDFESVMAKTSTLFSGSQAEFSAFTDQLLEISNQTGVAASELAEAAYSAESASVPVGSLGDMVLNSAQLAKAGFTDIDTALSATAKTMNAYGMMSDDVATTQANMEAVQRILIQTQNKGITTVGELGASLAQVTPTAAAFGVSFDQVGASLAGMTAQGTPTAQATTQLNALIAELGKEGTTAADNLAKAAEGTDLAGMSFSEMMASGADLNDVLGLIQTAADKNNLSMVDMFSSIEAGKAALSITNSDWEGNMEAMATEADVVGEAYSTMADTTSTKLETLKNKFTNMGIEAFAGSADILVGALDGVSQIVEAISPGLETLGTAALNMFNAIGPAVAEVMGMGENMSTTEVIISALSQAIEVVTGVIQVMTENMDIVVAVILAVAEGFIAFKAAMGIAFLAANPIVAIVIAIVAAGILLYKNWDKITAKAKEIWNAIKEKFSAIKNKIVEVWESVKAKTSSVWEGIKSKVSSLVEGVKTAVTTKITEIKTKVTSIWDNIKSKTNDVWNGIKTSISNTIGNIKSAVTEKFESIKAAISEKINAAKTAVSNAIDGIKSKFNFSWSLPHLKLPHFSVSGSFSLNPPSIPHFSVSWYKTGGIFDGPSVIGIGEATKEAAIPLEGRHMMPFAKAIAEQMTEGNRSRPGIVNHFNIYKADDPDEVARVITREINLQLRSV